MTTETKLLLHDLETDPDLTPGARNAIDTCLRVQPNEKVTLITDLACAPIGAALARELDRTGSPYNAFILENLAPRPLRDMPAEILADMETSDVSIFAVKAQANELRTRMQMTDVVNRRKMRHAHMVNIERRIMLEGMRANYEEVDRISTLVWRMGSAAKEIRATTAAGTDITGRFSPDLKWVKTSGIISVNKWGNLPGGETFTCPQRVDGVFVIDGVVGDYLCDKYGDLRDHPLTIRIADSRLTEAHSLNRELEDEFWRYCHTDENSDRVGEFAIGTNIALHGVIGNILQDEKLPGIHIAFGNPYGAHTGATWYSSTHIDVVGRDFDIWIDGRQIMHGGAFCLIRSHRQRFNREYSDAKYGRFLHLLEGCCGGTPDFRHSETPCFFPRQLIDKMARYGREMTEQLVADPAYISASSEAIPAAWRAPNEAPVPLFVQADFGLDQALEPKLVEIQGFPSLYAYQTLMAESYREAYALPADLDALPGGLGMDEYRALLGRAVLGDQDPENVVLMEIDPAHQKTRHDFVVTEKFFGVRTVDILAVRREGNRLFYERGGKRVPIHRIYNRVIVDDLERRGISIPFDFRDELDVEWAGHPNWFFRLSKFSLPYLKHPAVPRTHFLTDVGNLQNPERYVLKPLYSFAGVGVVVGPTAEQIAAIPAERRRDYILQERVDFTPVIDTPYGMTKVEVRIMYLWLDQLRPVNILIRMGRGAQMGVDHNKGLAWVGASAGFIDNNTP